MDNVYWMMQTDTQQQVLFPLSLERQYSGDTTSWALDLDCLFQIPSLSLTSCVNLEKLCNLLCFSSFIYEMEMAMIVNAHNMQSINISDFLQYLGETTHAINILPSVSISLVICPMAPPRCHVMFILTDLA